MRLGLYLTGICIVVHYNVTMVAESLTACFLDAASSGVVAGCRLRYGNAAKFDSAKPSPDHEDCSQSTWPSYSPLATAESFSRVGPSEPRGQARGAHIQEATTSLTYVPVCGCTTTRGQRGWMTAVAFAGNPSTTHVIFQMADGHMQNVQYRTHHISLSGSSARAFNRE